MINKLLVKISNEKKEKELDKIFKKYGFGKNDDKLNSEIIKFIEKYPDGSDILDRYLDKLDVAMDEAIDELAPLAEIAGDPDMIVFGVSNDMTGYVVPPNDFILHPTQPYLNGYRDKFDLNHYHETNSMGIGTQKVIADTFADVVSRF